MFDTYYYKHRTRIFSEIFPTEESFREQYKKVGLGGFDGEDTLRNLYVLLYARRGNDSVLSSDEQRFIYSLFSIIYTHGPEYEKRLQIQDRIRSMTDEELERGTTSINNHAYNPSTAPSTQEFEQIKKIDQQTASGYKRGKLEYLMLQADSLNSKFIEEFLRRFDKLFNPYCAGLPLIYNVGGESDED